MGDMADMFLDAVMDFEESRGNYRAGLMSHDEAYDRGIIDELGYEIGPYSGRVVACRCCGLAKGMMWGRNNGKWRLFENGALHQCPVNPLKETVDWATDYRSTPQSKPDTEWAEPPAGYSR